MSRKSLLKASFIFRLNGIITDEFFIINLLEIWVVLQKVNVYILLNKVITFKISKVLIGGYKMKAYDLKFQRFP